MKARPDKNLRSVQLRRVLFPPAPVSLGRHIARAHVSRCFNAWIYDKRRQRLDVAPLAHPKLLARAEALASACRPPGWGGSALRDILDRSHGCRPAAGAARLAACYALGATGGECDGGADECERTKSRRCPGRLETTTVDGLVDGIGAMSRVNCLRQGARALPYGGGSQRVTRSGFGRRSVVVCSVEILGVVSWGVRSVLSLLWQHFESSFGIIWVNCLQLFL